jgi:hypothetical protein
VWVRRGKGGSSGGRGEGGSGEGGSSGAMAAVVWRCLLVIPWAVEVGDGAESVGG